MDGVHDLGGMQGFGRVEREEDEPVFHARWEAEVWAMMRAAGGGGVYNVDEFRHAVERMRPAEYLAATYYEKWLAGMTRLFLEKGVLTEAELEARIAFFDARPEAPVTAPLTREPPAPAAFNPRWALDVEREAGARPRFAPGDPVITRNIHPRGHTRLPRYARGKRGAIHRLHGFHVFPDAHAHGLGEQAQPLYSVRFDAHELWGPDAEPRQSVYIDLWERYLEPGR